ncbi:MAG: glycosyl hydrolase [Lachnospiraceae bacterium]
MKKTWGKIMIFLLWICSITVTEPVSAQGDTGSPVMSGKMEKNQVENGRFDWGLTYWSFYSQNGCATLDWNEKEEAQININWLEGHNWDVIFIQKDVLLPSSAAYTLSFDAYASQKRAIEVTFKGSDSTHTFSLTKRKQRFEMTLPKKLTGKVELQFLLGTMNSGYGSTDGAHQVYLDDIQITDGSLVTDEAAEATDVPDISPVAPDEKQTYYILRNRASSYVLQATPAGEEYVLTQGDYRKQANQLFVLEKAKGKTYLRCAGTGQYLSARTTEDARTPALYFADNKTAKQQWDMGIAEQGYYSIVNETLGLAIQTPGSYASEAVAMQMAERLEENQEQQWDMIAIKGDSLTTKKPSVDNQKLWKKQAVTYPRSKKLVPAGPIKLQWYGYQGKEKVKEYRIFVDGKKVATRKPNGKKQMSCQYYSTKVSSHTMQIQMLLQNGEICKTSPLVFYITKKGVGWGTLHRTENMNEAWYYNWSMEPSLGTDENLEFIPMIWGNWGGAWLQKEENRKYGTVLSFNEPDFAEQSNVSVKEALTAWKDFENSGLRLGSPATAVPAFWSQNWFWNFMNGIEKNKKLDVDFIAIHCYMEESNPEGFLYMIDETWKKWKKPIWITEFGVAEWSKGKWNVWTPGAQKKVYAFMEKVLPELDKRPYVERYAWFPFDPEDEWGGASGIFDYNTGKLNKLGKLYQKLGVPKGYLS